MNEISVMNIANIPHNGTIIMTFAPYNVRPNVDDNGVNDYVGQIYPFIPI